MRGNSNVVGEQFDDFNTAETISREEGKNTFIRRYFTQ